MKTHLNDLFDQLEPEKGNKLDEKIQVDKSKLEEMVDELNRINEFSFDSYNSIAVLKHSAKEITSFSLLLNDSMLSNLGSNIAGKYLNKLIQSSPDQDHIIHTKHHNEEISFIGVENTKNIIVEGNIGDYLGYSMEEGKITVNGNTDASAGLMMDGGEIVINGNTSYSLGKDMAGGKITVNGNSDSYVGESMLGGEIIINGNVSYNLAHQMSGGVIHVNGNIGRLSTSRYDGDVFNYRKQIVKEGKILDRSYVEK